VVSVPYENDRGRDALEEIIAVAEEVSVVIRIDVRELSPTTASASPMFGVLTVKRSTR